MASSPDPPLGVSSFLSGGLAPEVSQEVAPSLGAVDEALRRLWEVLKEVGRTVELGFKV